MNLRHRLANRMLAWRVSHALWLWLGVRLMPLAAMALGGGGLFLPTGFTYAVLFSIATMSVEWVDERRLGLHTLYSNLGYSSMTMRLLTLICALAMEMLFNAAMLAWW